MTVNDWIELGKSMGPVAAGILFVLYVLAKNGLLKVVLREGGVDELALLRTEVNGLAMRIAILEDRWDRQ